MLISRGRKPVAFTAICPSYAGFSSMNEQLTVLPSLSPRLPGFFVTAGALLIAEFAMVLLGRWAGQPVAVLDALLYWLYIVSTLAALGLLYLYRNRVEIRVGAYLQTAGQRIEWDQLDEDRTKNEFVENCERTSP